MRFLATVPAMLLAAVPLSAQALDANEQAIVQFVDSHADEAVEFLERLVNINSGTMNRPSGQRFSYYGCPSLAFPERGQPIPACWRYGAKVP